jgi:hypothetical protein
MTTSICKECKAQNREKKDSIAMITESAVIHKIQIGT